MATLYLLPSTMSDAPALHVIPQYNIDVAARLKYFVVENMRTARRFLRRCDPKIDIDSLDFEVLNINTPPDEVSKLLAPLRAGHDVGVISEAGCPAVADPGADLVNIAQQNGFTVEPLVGPSSIIMSLMGSGFNGQRFAFKGYLPIDGKARTEALQTMCHRVEREGETQIFIETPYRNAKLAEQLINTLPPLMRLCIAVDITGPQQSIVTRTIAQWRKQRPQLSKIPTVFLLG